MPRTKASEWTVTDYEQAAERYLRRLPMEHFMEAIPQSTQREITLESLAILRSRRADVQVFNELLVQYFHKGRLRQVVPDNMVRLSDRPTVSRTSYNLELEQIVPFLVFEYVSPASHRKDYGESLQKYERELKVPYCLMYYPEREDLQVWHHNGESYERLSRDDRGRIAIPELELEVGVQEGWVRFWYRGELLPLPAELEAQRVQEKQRADQEKQRADQEKQRADQAEVELARLRDLFAQQQPGSTP